MLELILRVAVAVLLAVGSGGAPVAPVVQDAPDVDAYTAAIGPGLAQLGDGAGVMIETMAAPAVASEEWQSRATASFDAVRAGHASLMAVEPEAALAELHATLTAATQHCADGADAAQLAIDEGNVLALYAAAQLVQACADGLTEWTGMLDAMRK
jgi:hypothetical protein